MKAIEASPVVNFIEMTPFFMFVFFDSKKSDKEIPSALSIEICWRASLIMMTSKLLGVRSQLVCHFGAPQECKSQCCKILLPCRWSIKMDPIQSKKQKITLPETKPASLHPENGWLEDDFPCGKAYLGVSKNRGIPKWMVYNGKPY